MLPIKIVCACGQKFSFDVEPVNGQMPWTVACPSCGTDATAAANEIIARSSGASRLRIGGHAAPAAPAAAEPSLAPSISPTPRRRMSAKTLRLIGSIVAGLVLLIVGGAWYWKYSHPPSLVVTHIDPSFPNTLEELNKWYATPAEGQNAAEFFKQGFAALPDNQKVRQAETSSPTLPLLGKAKLPAPGTPLSPAAKTAIAAALKRYEPTMQFFQHGARCTESRYPLNLTLGANTLLPDLAPVKRGGMLAAVAALFHADAQQGKEAGDDILLALAFGRSLEQEPILISQLVRVACYSHAVDGLE